MSQLEKLSYLNNTTFQETLQCLEEAFPRPWQKRRCFLLWEWNDKTEKIQPLTLQFEKGKLLTKASMTGPLMTLKSLRKLFDEGHINFKCGIAVNLSRIPHSIAVDFDNILPSNLDNKLGKSKQQEVFDCLDKIPSYREVSSSRNGYHVLFSAPQFETLLAENNIFCKKGISKPTTNVELFIGGKVNKLLILTGELPWSLYPCMERRVYRSSRAKKNHSIINATSRQLRDFIQILKDLDQQELNTQHSFSKILTKNSLPNWLPEFSQYADKDLSLARTDFPKPETKRGYPRVLSYIKRVRTISFGGTSRFSSQSEVDFAILCALVKLYKKPTKRDLASLMEVCVTWYLNHLPARSKSHDYLIRSTYNAIRLRYQNQLSSITESEAALPNVKKILVKTPLGLLAESPVFPSNWTVHIKNRNNLKDFDWAIYEVLLAEVARQNKLSPHGEELLTTKIYLNLSVGQIARQITGNSRVSSYYYRRVLSGLVVISDTQIDWDTDFSKGNSSLLDFSYDKLTKKLQIVFSRLIAFCLTASSQAIKQSPFRYSVYYQTILNGYTTKQKRLYRFLINNSCIRGSCKTVEINCSLLRSFYPNYKTRRHSEYKKDFIKSLHEFSKIDGTDIRLNIHQESFTFYRVFLPLNEEF